MIFLSFIHKMCYYYQLKPSNLFHGIRAASKVTVKNILFIGFQRLYQFLKK
eukprot:UN06738